jgi:acetolactate synthase-1/2/3 large subunit
MGLKRKLERRKFIQGGIVASAAAIVQPAAALTQQPSPPTSEADILTTDTCGSDYMVDVIKSLGFEYVCANPGSSFRGMQESIINYGGNRNPEFITNCHEESSVAMAHGYFKIEGKPMAVLAHGTVGLQHAAMAIYNAWCDRVPIYIMLGNYVDAAIRRPAEWYHGVQDCAGMVRDFTKWDDQPASLVHFGESAVRAYKIAMTPPMAPVVLVLDAGLQESPIESNTKLPIQKLAMPAPPQGESAAVKELALMLVGAENPVLVADRLARTPAAMPLLIELAETLQAAVIDQGGRMNFPSLHPLNQSQRATAAIGEADVVVGLEVADFWAAVNVMRDQLHRSSRKLTKTGAKLATITSGDLYIKSNYQDFRRLMEVDLAIAADGEATLPTLIE